ncbi:MAG: hypothetical protein K9M81_00040 [Chthoniobacterales bacterium]|nr:hypothetical protein [Chthoniobacterales bacterium]
MTRSLPLVSPAVSQPPVVPHQPSRPPRYDQYEISGLTGFFTKDSIAVITASTGI